MHFDLNSVKSRYISDFTLKSIKLVLMGESFLLFSERKAALCCLSLDLVVQEK